MNPPDTIKKERIKVKMYNRDITISVASSSKSVQWTASRFTWQSFTERLKEPIRTAETYAQYCASSKSSQDTLKNVGGFVGGTFKGPRRLTADCTGRDLLTLDLDSIPSWATDDVLASIRKFNAETVIYSTRKHSGRTPRLRVVMPLTETIEPDKYEPMARMVCQRMGLMDYADPTTFEVGRMMYWPSCSSDSEYIYEVLDGAPVDTDKVLSLYEDWRDIASWPQVPGHETQQKRNVARAEDPTLKRGIIGAFCRTYTLPEAMDKFLPGLYEATNDPSRRTYSGGSTYGGAVIYNDLFLFSHHATDPCSGQLVNAWDLVRIQKYVSTGMDENAKDGTPVVKLPSYAAMTELATSDEAVHRQLLADRISAEEAFGEPPGTSDTASMDTTADAPADTDWQMRLEITAKGKVTDAIDNFVLILTNDEALKDTIAYEVFSSRLMVRRALPWDAPGRVYPRMYIDSDDSNIQAYIERRYGVYNKGKCDAAVNIVAASHSYNVVAEYLKTLTWDGKPRLGTLFHDYLGAKDTPYTRAVARKVCVAAVSRALTLDKQIKFDQMPILTGPQGIGKSTLLRYLAKDPNWFNDSLTTFEGKEAQELIQGSWIIEVGELAAMNKQESNAVKLFLSKVDDKYRKAFGKRTESHLRRGVFIGTTNDVAFLRDVTGNRRFWPVRCMEVDPTRDVFNDLTDTEVDQIWAEAKVYYQLGEALYMDTPELIALAEEAQEGHRQVSSMEGEIAMYLDEAIPDDWYEMDKTQRKIWRADPNNTARTDLPRRTKVSIIEIWEELYGRSYTSCSYQQKQELNQAMRAIKGWSEIGSVKTGAYGTQRGFKKN